MTQRHFVFVLLLVGILTACSAPQEALQPVAATQEMADESAEPDGPPSLTLEGLFSSRTFMGEFFRGGRWADQGPVVTFVDRDDEGVTHLVSYNLKEDKRDTLLEGSTLHAADVDRVVSIDDYAVATGSDKALIYTDSERVWRLPTKGYYYVYSFNDGSLTPISDRSLGFQMFAKMDPVGERVGFVRDRNLFVVELRDGTETQLTFDGSAGGVINGTSDWVYEEELGLRDAWRWSPDGKYIAFLQLDESGTRDYQMTDFRGQYPEFVQFRYPKAGEENSEIRAGIIDMSTNEIRFFDTGTWHAGGDSLEYLSTIGWTPEIEGVNYVWTFRMNRDQNVVDLVYGNPDTGEIKVVLTESEPTWIDVETGFSDMDVGKITFLKDGKHFVWISEVDGFRHLYLHKNTGERIGRITNGEWEVTEFHGIDESSQTAYFSATIDDTRERHLYKVPVDMNGGMAGGPPVRITVDDGWHSTSLSPDYTFFIDRFSTAVSPTEVVLYSISGERQKDLEPNSRLKETLEEYEIPPVEFMSVPAADGTPLNAYMVKPRDFDSNKAYRLLMHVYGGPGSQLVRNGWGGSRRLWHQMLADEHDILVAVVDNRGTGARGKAFKSVTYKKLGVVEAEDQIAAARHLAALPYVNGERIGIWGWSYGGFMTLMSMMSGDGPELFRLGVSVAPVSDWRQYDTIYTERYMSTPQKNAEGYDLGAPIKYVDQMADDQRLLLVHGDADDNVHVQNSIQMVDALQAANKQFRFMVYPGRNHGIYGGNTSLHLFTMITNFVVENL